MASARTVAVVVPSPAASLVLLATSRTIWAPMFSYGSSSSISLATVTPSLVTVGEPNFLSRTTLRPLGPRVAVTAFASFWTPFKSVCRADSSNTNCFAAILFLVIKSLELFDHGQDVVRVQDLVLFAIQLDFSAAVFADQDAVTLFDFEWDFLPAVVGFAGSEGDNDTFGWLLFRGIGNDDSALFGFLLFGGFYQNSIAQRFKVYGHRFCVLRSEER